MQPSEKKADYLASVIGEDYDLVDLGHTLEENMPGCVGHAKFGHILFESYRFGDISCHYQLTMSEHTGTHIDAPLHFIPGGHGIDQVDLHRTMGRAVMIDATSQFPNSLVPKSMIENWEKENGMIRKGDFVLFRFGWDRYWAKRPNDEKFIQDWPGLGKDSAEYLVEKGVFGAGTDAFSIDASNTKTFEAHHTLLANQVSIIENLAHLSQLPPFSYVIALPLKVKDGSGSPIRMVAFVPKGK